MRGSKRKRVLWDSSCFIAVLKGEQEHLSDLLKLLEDAKQARMQLVISTMAISEVVRPKGSNAAIPRTASEDIVRNFFENDYLVVRSHDRLVAELGRKLVWDQNVHPRDAIHLATALATKCDEVHTLDHKQLSLDGKIVGIRICVPKWTGQHELEEFLEAEDAARKKRT